MIVLPLVRRSYSTRVRFAPSPTGSLHLGGLRTAFYNFLFARKNGGDFILRLEDTDQKRLVPGAAKELEELLHWAGIPPDESPTQGGPVGPYVQSQRTQIYSRHAEELLQSGAGYRCFCSEKRLLLLKRDANRSKRANIYDRRCMHLSQQEVMDKLGAGIPYTIRFKIRPFKEGYSDLIFGHSHHDVFEFEGDPIIMKGDGYPTYHFANVVDDHLMGISHVFRGVEWQVSTPKHIMLYEAFGWKPPEFAHLPLIMNADGTKLSKRQRDINVKYYQENGYFPESIINFLCTVGGGFDKRDHSCEELYNMEELISKFNTSRISTFSGRIEKEKLDTLNRHCIKSKFESDKHSFYSLLRATYPQLKSMPNEKVDRLMTWSWNRIHTLKDISVLKTVAFAWFPPSQEIPSQLLDPKAIELLKGIRRIFSEECIDINKELKSLAKDHVVKYPEVMQIIRLSICGDRQGPPIKDILDVLGRSSVIERIDRVIQHSSV